MNDDYLLYQAYLKKKQQEIRLFPEQDLFINDKSQFLAAICTRRAGKTNALALKFKATMDQHPGSLSRYIALTRDSAKDIMWPVLEDLNERFNWEATLTQSDLTMTLKNGSRLRLYGADMRNFIRRLRGTKSPANAIDECQELGSQLETLVNDILTPSILDYKGSWLALTGTPGIFPKGLFYEITEQGSAEYSIHKWSWKNNPYLEDAQQFVDTLKRKHKWEETNPTYLREWLGRWVLDLESLLIKYDEKKNHYQALPPGHWNYILGIDIGIRDADALAVLAWSESTPNIYLLEELITNGQDITELTNQINYMLKRYDITKIVMDEGALGKKIAEELRRRRQIPVQAADKTRKMENVAFLNDWLRLGKFKAKKESKFVRDSQLVQIDWEKTTPTKLEVKKSYHSDIIDAVLYAFKESPAFTYQSPIIKPKYGTPEWARDEVTDMERAAEDHFNKQAEDEKQSAWGWQ